MYTTQYIYQYRVNEDSVLVVNTMTGAADVVDNDLAKILKPSTEINITELPQELVEVLIERGYLTEQNDEKQRVAKWFEAYEKNVRGMQFIVCPSFTCNLRCFYCYEDLEIREAQNALTEDQVDRMFEAMDRVVQERNAGPIDMEFYGGEPFLAANKKIVEKMTRLAVERGWSISAITNGTQLHHFKDMFQRILPVINQIQISLDGPPEIHDKRRIHANGRGSFDMIADNVTMLLEMGVRVALRINTGANNAQELPTMFRIFEERGWLKYPNFASQLAPINDHLVTGCTPDYQPEHKLLSQLYEMYPDWERVREYYHVYLGYDLERRTKLFRRLLYGNEVQMEAELKPDLSGCSASKKQYLVFGADGRIYSCPETVGFEDAAIGRFDPVYELDYEMWGQWDLNISNTAKCVSCNIAPLCGGACPWHGFNASSFDAYEPHCNYAQNTIKSYLDLNKTRLIQLFEL